ncbi:MAG: mceA [Frankiales bacterium]|jgi:phospholipid/cholesterol/gamma-HCH transport system substrate-binding protein|nr:mceA [Frankiales bacterium]
MSPPLVSGRRRVKQQLVGLLFLGVLAGIVTLAILLYQKAFTPVVMVTLQASSIGNQLSTGGDVKARGLLVGDIRDVATDGDGATITMALKPEAAAQIPSDTKARLLPKTLFGEKFVALEFEDDSTADPLSEGDVISRDDSAVARETEQTLNDLLPLLRALKPAQVSTTLNAVSGALRGRGDQIGRNLELVDTYLKGINPDIPALGENFRGVADFADNLERTTPDIVEVLDNLSAISGNLVDQEQELNTFLTSTTGFSEELGSFLEENDERLITLARDSLPALQVYARYSPEFPCLSAGLVKQEGLARQAFGGLQPGLHITLEFAEDQNGYLPGQDEPEYGADNGPTCRGLPPNPAVVPFPIEIEVKDGYCDEQEEAPGVLTECVREEPAPVGDDAASQPAVALAQRDRDKAAVNAVIGPVLGVAPADVPDLALLLFGPVARGTQVGLASD